MKLMNASIISLAVYIAPFYAMNDKDKEKEKELFNKLELVRYGQFYYSQDREVVQKFYKMEDEVVKEIENFKVSASMEKNKIVESNRLNLFDDRNNDQELKDIILEWRKKYLNQEYDDKNCIAHVEEKVISDK